MRIFSNLNLNGSAPARVQPRLGEWGPDLVPSTRQKRRMRIWVGLALLGAMLAVFGLGWYVYHALTGSWGFGIGTKSQYLGSQHPGSQHLSHAAGTISRSVGLG